MLVGLEVYMTPESANSFIYKKITEDNLLADVGCRNILGEQIPG